MAKTNNTSIQVSHRSDSNLTEKQQDQAVEIARKLDIRNQQSVMNFGVETQKRLGDSSTKILNQVKTKDADEAGEALSELVKQIQGFEISQNWFERTLSKIPVVNKLVDHTKKIIAQHNTVEQNLDDIVNRLDKGRISLVKDNTNLESLFEETCSFIEDNKINIEVLKIKLDEIRNIHEPELQLKITQNPHDEMLVQDYSNLKDIINSLDKKIYNMQLFGTSALQSLPRLKLIAKGNNDLMENIQMTALNVIPLWRNQVAEAISLNKQAKVAQLQEAIYQMTNDLIKSNSERTKENSIAIAKQMERGIIDIETLEATNKQFIATLEEVIKIKELGSKTRLDAQEKIKAIELELTNKIKSFQISSSEEAKLLDAKYQVIDDFTPLATIQKND